MANWSDPRTSAAAYAATGARTDAYDAGLRSYMLSVYNYMASGVLLTGIVALLFAKTGWSQAMYNPAGGASALGWIVTLSPLAVVMVMSFGQNRLSTATLQTLFWVYAGLVGLSLSTLFMVYTDASIAQVFFATAAGYAALSLWGYTTKRDLTGMGSFLMVGLIAVIVASLVNLFLGSSLLQMGLSVIGVIVFAGLTAWDTQRLKSEYLAYGSSQAAEKLAIMGALSLYLNLINMFQLLLGLMGQREE